MQFKRAMLLLFFLLSGTILGALLAAVCADVSFLSWLAFSREIGFSPDAPFVLDLSVVKLVFGFTMSFSVAQIITIAISIVLYNLLKKKF